MPTRKWDDRFYVEAFRWAKVGLADSVIAVKIGVVPSTFLIWLREKPTLAEAVKAGRRKEATGLEMFREHVRGKMTPQAQEAFDALTSGDRRERDAAQALLRDGGRKVRQQLFVLAMLEHNFSAFAARTRLGVRDAEFELWREDARFMKTLAGLLEAKKDFFEGSLIDLVAKGDSAAVIFANKTLNRDRGYGETVEHSHTHTHAVAERQRRLDNLSPEEKRVLLTLLAKAEGSPAPPQLEMRHAGPAVDAIKEADNGEVMPVDESAEEDQEAETPPARLNGRARKRKMGGRRAT